MATAVQHTSKTTVVLLFAQTDNRVKASWYRSVSSSSSSSVFSSRIYLTVCIYSVPLCIISSVIFFCEAAELVGLYEATRLPSKTPHARR